MANNLTIKDINDLTSKYWYSSFERGQEGCENLDFYSNINGDFEQKYRIYELHRISDKILKALCFIYNKKNIQRDSFDEELCSYLYYWLGDKIYPKVQNQTVFSNIIKMIYDELSRTSMFRTCTAIHDNIDENTFNVYKLLFDYSSDDYHINLNTVNPNTKCDVHYIETINKYINTYNDVYLSCYVKEDKKYDCAYFHKLFKKDKYMQLPPFYCVKYDPLTSSTEAQREHTSWNNSFPNLPTSEKVSSSTENVDPQGNKVYHLRYPLYENKGSVLRYEVETDSPLPTEKTSDGGSSKTIAGSIVPVLGVSSFSLLLYKVTPVGGYINRLLGRNSNMYNNIEYMDSFNPYSDGMVPGDRRMNISYHRL
ncbi:PIR protein [Plasmodium vivax]|nr:PIR protein [Plasmodium vivax]